MPHALLINNQLGVLDFPISIEATIATALPGDLGVKTAAIAWMTKKGIRVCGGAADSEGTVGCKLWTMGTTVTVPSPRIPSPKSGTYIAPMANGQLILSKGRIAWSLHPSG